MKKYTVYIVWGYIHQPHTPKIKIAAFSTKKAAEKFIAYNSKCYDCMEIRTFTGTGAA